jgi:quercetin dioxygenase-like cupin family protein
MTYAFSSLDELGDGPGFRKIRQPLGVEAFGVNAIVFPAHYEGPEHFHDTQDELYFVHRGRIRVDVGGESGESRELGEGGLFHCGSTTPRRISNIGEEDAVVFVVGGKDGYVERDGHLVNEEVDLPRRQGLS